MAISGLPQLPRRALLQFSDNRPAFSSVNNLLVFTGLLVGLAVAIMVIGCLCTRHRRRHPRPGRREAAFGERHSAAHEPRQQQLILWQQAKLVQLPILVVSPDNQVSYAQKLGPGAEAVTAVPALMTDGAASSSSAACVLPQPTAAAGVPASVFPAAVAASAAAETQRQQSAPAALESIGADEAEPSGATALGIPGPQLPNGAMAAATVQNMLPAAAASSSGAAAPAAQQWDSSATAAAAQALRPLPADGASGLEAASPTAASPQGSSAASPSGSRAASVRIPSLQAFQTRVYRGFQRWSDANTARELQAQELQMLRLQRHQLLRSTAQEPEVRLMPAFIEWDVSSGGGPILHPPPPPPDLTGASRAAAVAHAEAALLARAGGGGRLWRASSFRSADGSAPGEPAGGGGGGGATEAGSTRRSASMGLAEVWRHGVAWRPSLHATSAPPRASRLSTAAEAAAGSGRPA